jgi:Zn-dependent M28 family amino/carboxypeptidase
MHGQKKVVLAAACGLLASLAHAAEPFSGSSALAFTRQVVSFGPRPSGSAAIGKLQRYIVEELKRHGWEVIQDSFTAQTPLGPVKMMNIIGRLAGKSGRAVVVTGHYETKSLPGIRFVGANDGGASAGFLLELARVLPGRPLKHDVYLVWFDGEESFGPWSETDGIYGSRHLAARWSADDTLGRIRALINVDMIGDKDLGILEELNSTSWLRRLVWQTAAETGLGRYFLNVSSAVEDDHIPFLRRGVPAVDLIDFDYGPGNSWWHTERDTLDKLSADSLQVVGTVVLEVLNRLQ